MRFSLQRDKSFGRIETEEKVVITSAVSLPAHEIASPVSKLAQKVHSLHVAVLTVVYFYSLRALSGNSNVNSAIREVD